MRFLNNGEELTKEELQKIANNYFISKHAKMRLKQRGYINIKKIILNPLLAYYNTDGSINIAKNRYNYLVIVYNDVFNNFKIVTYKEKSLNSIDIFTKQKLAKKGIDRK